VVSWDSIKAQEKEVKVWTPKNPEIPFLDNYSTPPKAAFWDIFPSRMVPRESPIDTKVLESELNVVKDSLTPAQFLRGERAIDNVRLGGSAFQGSNLPAIEVKNSSSVNKFGQVVTDNTASWIKSNFVCGPFSEPPFERFRVNCISPIEQNDKVRIVVNASLPEGESFNSNVVDHKLEKVRMTSAKKFGHGLLRAGEGAVFSKFDQKDAYKNIPCKKEDLRLQGFKWLGKFFFESAQMFGARTAVANYDVLGNTLLSICVAKSGSQSVQVFRQLDDVPIIGKKDSNGCEEFSKLYKTLCESANIRLAEDCPKKDKAFTNVTSGKVLGINFDSTNLTWSFPEEKKEKLLNSMKKAIEMEISLKELQSLVGQMSDLAQMSPFLSIFKKPILEDLAQHIRAGESSKRAISDQAKKDLSVWASMLLDKSEWHKIPWPNIQPPRYHKSVYSDAAGLAEGEVNSNGVGVAWMAFNEEGEYIGAQRLSWPKEFIENKKDSKGARFGCKTTTLELFGILLPVLELHKCLSNQHIIFHVDNIACVYGWENGHMKDDICASILIRGLKLIELYLGSKFHLRFVPRVSDWESAQTDRMSRLSSLSKQDIQLLESFSLVRIHRIVLDWLENPEEDWGWALRLLEVVSSKD